MPLRFELNAVSVLLPAVATCSVTLHFCLQTQQHKERLQSPPKQLPCSVLPSAGGSLVAESWTKRAGETPCKKQCKDTAGENYHNMNLHQNSPLFCGEKLALCWHYSVYVLSNCSFHKYLTRQRCVSAQGYDAEVRQTWCSQRSGVCAWTQLMLQTGLLVREVHGRTLAAGMPTPTLMSIPSLAWRYQHWEVPGRPSPGWAQACLHQCAPWQRGMPRAPLNPSAITRSLFLSSTLSHSVFCSFLCNLSCSTFGFHGVNIHCVKHIYI